MKKLNFKYITTIFVFLITCLKSNIVYSNPSTSKTWIFFDLGNTIIDTSKRTYKYVPGAWKYINELKAKGYSIGIISNIPESFGNSQLEKLGSLKAYVKKKWNDQIEMDWKQFDKIMLPPSDAKRKPHPHMFLEAKNLISNCPVFFQGEDPVEVKTAAKLGLQSYQVGVSINFFQHIDLIEDQYYKSLNQGYCSN